MSIPTKIYIGGLDISRQFVLDCCPRSLLSDTFNQTIKTLQSNYEDTPDTPLSNSEIKNESIFIIPFLIDFYTFSVTVDTKKRGNVSPLRYHSLSTDHALIDAKYSAQSLIFSCSISATITSRI